MEEQPNNKRRNLIFLAVLVVVLFGLVAIFITRSRGTASSGNTNNTATGQVTLQWWGTFLDSTTVQPLLAEYTAANPNVKIQYVNKWPGGSRDGAQTQYYASLDAIFSENNSLALPDIFMVDNTMVGYYENETTPAPASVISASELSANFYPVVATNLVKAGQVRGLPLWVDTLAIVYNRNLLLQAGRQTLPTEWTEFKNLSQQLTTVVGTNRVLGFAAGTTKNASFGTDLLQLLFLQDGINLTDAAGRPAFASNATNAVDTLSFFKGFAGSGGSWSAANADNDALAFMKGNLAMIVAPSWLVNDFLDINRAQSLNLNIGVSKIPQISGSAEINWGNYWANVVASKRPNSVEAWKFLKWVSEPAQLRKLRIEDSKKGRSFSFIYPRADMRTELENTSQYLEPYLRSMSTATSWYMGNGVKLRASLAELIESAGTASNVQSAQTKALEALQDKL